MPADLHVRNVVLLAPSVSPGYELGPSAGHVEGTIWVFYSPHDKLFLSWRTGNFGTYDGIKTPAAGNRGFDPAMVEALHGKVVQHAYDPAWAQLGNDGDHGGWLAKAFATTVLAALLQ